MSGATDRFDFDAVGGGAGAAGRALTTPFKGAALLKGGEFTLQGRASFSRLIYPIPAPGAIPPSGERRAASVYAEVRRYWPGLRDGALTPDRAGVRPKLHAPANPNLIFASTARRRMGWRGRSPCSASKSPSLTASLAMGKAGAEGLGS